MKIIFIGPRSIPAKYGGIDTHTEKLAYYLVNKRGNDVTIYVRKAYNNLAGDSYKGIKIRNIFTFPNKYLDTVVYGLMASLKVITEPVDIVHYQGGSALFSFIPYFFKKKVVITIHGLEWKRKKWGRFVGFFLRLIEEMSFRYSHILITVSKGLEKYFKQKHNQSDRILYIPNGVETSPFLEASEILRYNLKKDTYILSVARLVPEKGVHYLIEAYKSLDCELKLVIAGDAPHQDRYAISIKKQANENIIFTGYIEGRLLQELYSNAYIYVQPSELEGMAITILEAMNFGRCVLTSDIPENREALLSYGVFFKNKNTEDLRLKLLGLINNKNIVQELGKEAKRYAAENLSWEKIAEQLEAAYSSLEKR